MDSPREQEIYCIPRDVIHVVVTRSKYYKPIIVYWSGQIVLRVPLPGVTFHLAGQAQNFEGQFEPGGVFQTKRFQ